MRYNYNIIIILCSSRPPRTILLFGPRGTGKTLLSRCISTQLGSTLLKLSGKTLLSTWKAEAEKILQTVFFVASCRQPAVVLITEAESLLVARAGEDGSQASNLKSQLLSYLDNVATSSEQNVVVIGTTSRPGSMDEASHRRFAKRFYVSPPDSIARRQILHHALAQQNSCLSEREMASLVQHTESFSGSELVQLCQHAGATTLIFLFFLFNYSGKELPQKKKKECVFKNSFYLLRKGKKRFLRVFRPGTKLPRVFASKKGDRKKEERKKKKLEAVTKMKVECILGAFHVYYAIILF
uniref:AAA+ ATPase domain-containing protein n=1 Tax=Buteo japonicus TaxID=224669 RepID=A0A8C0ASJ8_9AVES